MNRPYEKGAHKDSRFRGNDGYGAGMTDTDGFRKGLRGAGRAPLGWGAG